MVAVEFGEQRGVDGSYTAKAGCATAVTKAAQKRKMILLTAGVAHVFSFRKLCPDLGLLDASQDLCGLSWFVLFVWSALPVMFR